MVVSKTAELLGDLHAYTAAHTSPPDDLFVELVGRTRERFPEAATMQVSTEQATLLGMLAGLVGARRAVEVGTFTGLSALAVARGMPPDGRLLCLDVSTEYTDLAREFWARAGVDDRIELRIGPAAESLAALPEEPHLDLAFVDADKEGYATYWARLVPRMRPGGLIIVDNVLWHGRVLDPAADDPDTAAIRAFNEQILRDDRVEVVMLLVGDGFTLARRR